MPSEPRPVRTSSSSGGGVGVPGGAGIGNDNAIAKSSEGNAFGYPAIPPRSKITKVVGDGLVYSTFDPIHIVYGDKSFSDWLAQINVSLIASFSTSGPTAVMV